MDKKTADILIQANNRFYAEQAQSFSQTRHNIWPGWNRAMDAVSAFDDSSIQVTDIASGNFRFEAFLEQRFPEARFDFNTIDNAPFVPAEPLRSNLCHHELDVLSSMMAEDELALPCLPAHLTVSFGFMHHVPGMTLRTKLLRMMSEATHADGIVAISLWRFLDNPQLAARAEEASQPACDALKAYGLDPASLDEGDAFLGWDAKPDVWRYCHSFSDADVEQLVDSIRDELILVDRFRSDGRNQSLNEYLVFRKL